VLDGCNSELAQYCAEVTPGEGRLLACLYAHEDKLSGQCERALMHWQAAGQAAPGRVAEYRQILKELEAEALAILEAFEDN
jgi:hypothetical protein